MSKQITVGLAGNPNAGKTTVFNALTGARQHVGNYPGVTVEQKEGFCEHRDYEIRIVDLPGTYSLTAYSMEELIARDFVVEEKPDVIVDVVDAANLERNLYLTTQFIELDQPTVVALNMIDVAEHTGKKINHERLSALFGIPMVPMAASKRRGMEALLDTIVKVAETGEAPQVHPRFGTELEEHIGEMEMLVAERGLLTHLPARWIAIKLLENDSQVRELVEESSPDAVGILAATDAARAHLARVIGDDAEVAVADHRYGFASGAVRQALHYDQVERMDWSDAVDRILVNRVLGLPIFVLMMWAMFEMVFRFGNAPMAGIESAFEALGNAVAALVPDGELESLVVDGIISGVGGVLIFVPNIVLLFVGISLLEDSGYMARAAFVVDRIMHHVGLHGKSFIPMLIGFGCTVPAVMATRTLDTRRDRIVTILIVPLMSCGARLPVYILLAGAFFPAAIAGKVIFSIYALGVLMAMAMALLFRSTVLTGETTPFVMELPPYRMPTLSGVAIHVWERAWQYVKKAGTVILAFAIVMWFLMSYPKPPAAVVEGLPDTQAAHYSLEYSAAGRLGRALEPALKPLGFNWQIGTALIAGFGAKEVVVSTLGTAYSLGETGEKTSDLRTALQNDPSLSPLVAYTFMVFVLLYLPCLATTVIIWRETGSWKWPLFAVGYTTVLAYVVSLIVYQGGMFLGYG